MRDKIIKMFNNISAADYYISNPYSSMCNKAFKKIFCSKDFLKYFYLLSNRTYERLSTIANVSEDSTKNTIFITGFRGCGKTCFMNLLNSLIISEYEIPEYKECKEQEKELVALMSQEKIEEEKKRIDEKYKNSSNNINITIRTQMHLMGMESIEKNYASFLNSSLTGKSVFLNFEKGNSSNDDLPFDKKFILKIEDIINDIICSKGTGTANAIFANIINLYNNNINAFNNTFEYRNTFLTFIKFCEEKLLKAKNFSEQKIELDKVLDELNLEQLICILVLMYCSVNLEEYKNTNKKYKIFFILDNMDIIYRTTILEESMHEYSNFIENMNSLMEEIENTDDSIWNEMYENITFIFAMRETTAMQIADHFIDEVEFVVKHFDISLDIDKSLVVEKKYQYVKKYQNEIENEDLKRTLFKIHKICTDYYIKSNIFPMFNNDYKRSMTCITSICEKNEGLIDQEIQLSRTKSDFNKNGARGIIFRVIFNEFLTKRYFEKIGMEPPANHNQNFTISRPILTLLYNLLPEYDKEEFNDEDNERLIPETISLAHLYSLCRPIMEKKRFIDALLGMFSLKKAPTWNHLITFDNIKKVTYQELDVYLTKLENDKNIQRENDIELRITCAGSNYIKFICTHFEFFSCRYTKNTLPLFANDNSLFSEDYGDYNFEYIIRTVYNAVVKCCEKLEIYNQTVIKYQQDNGGVPLLESDYVFKSKEDNMGRLHEERIIHWHIRYIDNYRMHLIKDIYIEKRKKIKEINKKIITYIEKYIDLLKNPLFSNVSMVLNRELTVCIKYIKQRNYYDITTQISRHSYKQLQYEGKINGRT